MSVASHPSPGLSDLRPSTGSQLIDALPRETRLRWQGALTEVRVQAGAVLISSGQVVSHVYFPATALVTTLNPAANDVPMATTLVGATAMVGLGTLLDDGPAGHDMVVLVSGTVLRMQADTLRDEFERSLAVRRLFLWLTRAYITELSQLATCNRFHTLEQQLCLRLLQIMDHIGSNELAITQSELAQLIGARRERVNQIIGSLQAAGTVELGRGRLTDLDRPGLLKQVCGCHAVLAKARAQLKALADAEQAR